VFVWRISFDLKARSEPTVNKQQFLTYLSDIKGKQALSGQHIANDASTTDSYNQFIAALPHVPAMLGVTPKVGQGDDLTYNPVVLALAAAHTDAGGVLIVDCHFADPWLPSGQQNIASAWVPNPEAAKPDLSQLSASFSVSAPYLAFWSQVDRLTDFLNALPPSALVILRLLHEGNGTWFWWGADSGNLASQEAKQLALHTALYAYVNKRVKKSLVWMHAASGESYYAPAAYARPSFVDLVGCSLYDNNLTWVHSDDFTSMINTGKPVFLSEAGPSEAVPQTGTWDTRTLLNIDPRIVGWQCWQGSGGEYGYMHLGLAENLHAADTLNSPRTVNLDTLPETVAAPVASAPSAPKPPGKPGAGGVPNPWSHYYHLPI
jgi:mannan endo-1,4-beta-mannosidase